MAVKRLFPELYMIPGLVNIYALETADGLALIDTGFPNTATKTIKALASIGKTPRDIRHIILTHGHVDHMGSAAALQRASGAQVYAHAEDTPIIERGGGFRPVRPAPGLRNQIMFKLFASPKAVIEPTHVDHYLRPGEPLPFLSDMVSVHIPGHSAGQLALLWHRHGGVLFAADVCVNRGGLKLTFSEEDIDEARRSLAKLAGLDFKVACFGHGPPIMSDAAKQFRQVWLS